MDAWASETFAVNHPNSTVVTKDLTAIDAGELKSSFSENSTPEVIIGGPPCQGFSIANHRNEDPKDPRNTLFMEMVRVARLFEPRLIVLENVPNLIRSKTHEKKSVIEIIENEFFKIGYYVYSTVLDATNFGVPQIRKRLFIAASKTQLDSPFPQITHTLCNENYASDLFDRPLLPCPTLWDAISDLPQLSAGEGKEVSTYSLPPKTQYQSMLRQQCIVLSNHVAMNHRKRMVERFRSMTWGQSVSDVPYALKPKKRNSQEIARLSYDQNNRRMHPDKPCHTIPASFYANFVHPYCHRNFTAREGARIQSFPDKFVFRGKPTVVSQKLLAREGRVDEIHLCQYNQIGNAVPPLLAAAIAAQLLEQIWRR